MEICAICYNLFNHSTHRPFSLNQCGHSFCYVCLKKLPKKECPLCKQIFQRINLNKQALELIIMSEFDIKIKKLKNLTKTLEEAFTYISLNIDDEIEQINAETNEVILENLLNKLIFFKQNLDSIFTEILEK
jgi:hypothetical protein